MARTLGRIFTHPDIEGGKPCLRLPFPEIADTRDKPGYMPVAKVLAAIEQGQDPGLSRRDINLCNAFAATNLPGTSQYTRNNRYRTVQILFDENMPYGLVPELMHELSNLTHVYLEGMGGYTDEFIYNRRWNHLDGVNIAQDRKEKNIIITRDMDMTDLVREQWMKRIASCATPDAINFRDVNVVFRIRDESLTDVENVECYVSNARSIMKAAFSCEAASYIIGQTGVRPEPGSRFADLVAKIEADEKLKRAKSGLLSNDELAVARENRIERRMAPRTDVKELMYA